MDILEMARTFNCGIGLLIFVDSSQAEAILAALKNGPEPDAWIAGYLAPRSTNNSVVLDHSDCWLVQ